MFKLNDNNTKTHNFYETRILKATDIFNFQIEQVKNDDSSVNENNNF